MAKKSAIARNNKRKLLSEKYWKTRQELKKQVRAESADIITRETAAVALAKLPRDSAAVRVRNRCIITGRPRGYHRRFSLCRNMLRSQAANGLIPGIQKSSW